MAEWTSQSRQTENTTQHSFFDFISLFHNQCCNAFPPQTSHVAFSWAAPDVSPTYWRKAGCTLCDLHLWFCYRREKCFHCPALSSLAPDFLAHCLHQTHSFRAHQSIKTGKVCFTIYVFPTIHEKWEGVSITLAHNKNVKLFSKKKCKPNLFPSQPFCLKVKSLPLPKRNSRPLNPSTF